MKAKFLTFKSNKDGSMVLYFDKGLDKHRLLDLENCEVEINSISLESAPPEPKQLSESDFMQLIREYGDQKYNEGLAKSLIPSKAAKEIEVVKKEEEARENGE